MKLNHRPGLGGLLAASLFIAAGCNLNVNQPPVGGSPSPSAGTSPSPRPSASASTAPMSSASPTASATPSGTTPTFFKCETTAAVAALAANNDFPQAQSISACSVVSGKLTADDAVEMFMIKVPAGVDGDLTFSLNETNNALNVRWEIFEADKTSITTVDGPDGNTNPTPFKYNVTGGATYYLKLSGDVTAEAPTTYALTTKFMPAMDSHEPNDTFETAKALTSGMALMYMDFAGHDTHEGDDMDYFKIDVPAGKTKINVKIENKSTAQDTNDFRIELLNSAKASQDTKDGTGGQANYDQTFDVDAAGTYYLKLTGSGNSMIMHPLTVTVQ